MCFFPWTGPGSGDLVGPGYMILDGLPVVSPPREEQEEVASKQKNDGECEKGGMAGSATTGGP